METENNNNENALAMASNTDDANNALALPREENNGEQAEAASQPLADQTSGGDTESDARQGEATDSACRKQNETTPPDGKKDSGNQMDADLGREDGGEEPPAEADEKSMGLLDHLGELRNRLIKATIGVIIGFGVCWAFVDPLFEILVHPLLSVLPTGAHAQYTTLPEAFFIRMQIAFVAGLFLASPVIFYQIWAFVAPGLYDEEKRYIFPVALLSAIFFAGGAAFCYYIVFPFAFNFFISYSTPEIIVTPKISDYINFVLKLLFAFGIIFEMPIFTLFLARMGLVTAKMMRKGQKYAIVVIFIVAAILTPPDVVSQLLMACPMLALYEISIGVAAIFGKKQKKEHEGSE